MAVRAFDGVDDRVQCAIGGSTAPSTLVALVRLQDLGKWQTPIALWTDSLGVSTALQITSANLLAFITNTASGARSSFTVAQDEWVLIVGGKASGTATPRLHYYRFSTETWVHGDAVAAIGDGDSVAGGVVVFGQNWGSGLDYLDGDIAAAAVFDFLLSDAGVEDLVEVNALEDWLDLSPVGMWDFRQESTATPVTDLTGNGADQTALTGTTVLVEDPPIPYESVPGPPEVTGAATGVDHDHDSATLNGTVDPNGQATSYYFEYGETTAYGSFVPLSQNADAGTGFAPVAVARLVIGLEPETTYHYRIVATNATGTDLGDDKFFLTSPVPEPAPAPAGPTPQQTWAERLYETLQPLAYADPELSYPLRSLCEGIGLAHQPLEDLIADTDDGPGWSALFDVDRCPVWALPWLAQLFGVRLPKGTSEAEARERIRTPAGFARGTVAATIAAAQRKLTGLRKVIVLERTDGNAYRYTVVTRTGETPDPAAVEHEIRADKPVGLILTYVVSIGPIVNELEDTIDDQVGTIDAYLTA